MSIDPDDRIHSPSPLIVKSTLPPRLKISEIIQDIKSREGSFTPITPRGWADAVQPQPLSRSDITELAANGALGQDLSLDAVPTTPCVPRPVDMKQWGAGMSPCAATPKHKARTPPIVPRIKFPTSPFKHFADFCSVSSAREADSTSTVMDELVSSSTMSPASTLGDEEGDLADAEISSAVLVLQSEHDTGGGPASGCVEKVDDIISGGHGEEKVLGASGSVAPSFRARVAAMGTPRQRSALAYAGAGAVGLGTAAGTVGGAVGGTAGAVLGFGVALFTFGLSIPVGAVIGASLGVGAGAVAGSSAGFAIGGVTGYYKGSEVEGTEGEGVDVAAIADECGSENVRIVF